jgi:hypothetical protein
MKASYRLAFEPTNKLVQIRFCGGNPIEEVIDGPRLDPAVWMFAATDLTAAALSHVATTIE